MANVLYVKNPILKNLIQFVAINGFAPDGENYIPVMPDGKSALVINTGKPYVRIQSPTGSKSLVKGSHFVGIKSRYCYVKPDPDMKTVSVRFKPGALPFFFKFNLQETTDQVIAADELFGRDICFLEEQIDEAIEPNDLLKRVELFLLQRLKVPPRSAGMMEKIKLIYSSPAEGRMEDIRCGNESYKKLERDFIQHIGLAPKLFIDLVRFNYSTSLLFKHADLTLTDAGYQAGYYDQSHFIKSFKKFSGYTPGKYLKQNSDMFLDNQRIVSEEF